MEILKSIALTILSSLFLISTSCNDVCYAYIDQYYRLFHVVGHELYRDQRWDGLTSQEEILLWINDNIDYRSESTEEWADHYKTISRGYGDCDDFAILYMNMAYFILNKKTTIAIVERSPNNSLIKESDHTVVINAGKMIDVIVQEEVKYPILLSYRFDEVFN